MRKKIIKKLLILPMNALLGLLFLLFLFPLSSCDKKINYFEYVSELRSNILLAKSENFSLRIYAVTKESPYLTDGIPKERSTTMEAYLVAPEGDKTCQISFSYEGKEYGGEMSFDNVKTQYFLSCSLDLKEAKQLACHVKYGDQSIELNAVSVKTDSILTPEQALQKVQTEESELFASLTDQYGFKGEIYLRLIYEDAPYYYVGIIDRNGNVHAFLMNAISGKILAKRSP